MKSVEVFLAEVTRDLFPRIFRAVSAYHFRSFDKLVPLQRLSFRLLLRIQFGTHDACAFEALLQRYSCMSNARLSTPLWEHQKMDAVCLLPRR